MADDRVVLEVEINDDGAQGSGEAGAGGGSGGGGSFYGSAVGSAAGNATVRGQQHLASASEAAREAIRTDIRSGKTRAERSGAREALFASKGDEPDFDSMSTDEMLAFLKARGKGARAARAARAGGATTHAAANSGMMYGVSVAGAATAAALGLVAVASAAWTFSEGLEAAKKAAEFSGDVFAAKTVSEVRERQSQIQQAQEIGPELANLLASRSELSIEFRELKTELLRNMLPKVTVIVDILTEIVNVLGGVMELYNLIENLPETVLEKLLLGLGLNPDDVSDVVAMLKGPLASFLNYKNKERTAQNADMLKQWNDFLDPVQVEKRLKGGGNF